MKSSFCIDLQRFMLIPTKFPLSRKRTIIKEKLYKYINSKIRELHPGFNIGESTGISQIEERWTLPYSHWSFKPSNYVRDTSKAKK